MKRIRPFLGAAAALALASSMALLPVLLSATPAYAAVTCTGTSLLPEAYGSGHVRVPTTANNTLIFDCELGPGNQGVAVERLQIALDYCDLHANLAIDGIYGPLTEAAVKALQTYKGITPDGIYGPVTATHMAWEVAGSNYTECDYIFTGE